MSVLDRASSIIMKRRVLAATSGSYVVILFDTSIVNVALDRISLSLATDIAGLQWVMNAYTLAFAGSGYSPLWAGLAFLPMTAVVAIGSIVSNRLVKLCRTPWSMCAAFGCYAMGALGMLSAGRTSPYWLAVAPMLAIGLASGFISPAATAPAMEIVEKHRAGVAAAVLNSARQTGASLGVAISGH